MLSQISEHAAFGGVVPEIAARAHVEALDRIIAKAMAEAGASFDRASTASPPPPGPGLIGGVIVGLTTAKAIALVSEKPLIAVNHLEAHALTARLTDGTPFPYCLFLASGGHTQIVAVRGVGDYVRLGTTIDDAIGEAFDKTAKLLGLGYPGGPQVEKEAARGNAAALRAAAADARPAERRFLALGPEDRAAARSREDRAARATRTCADLCASFQQAVVDVVADRLRAGMKLFRERYGTPTALVAAGGVAANEAIRKVLHRVAFEAGTVLVVPPPELCTDNGAMIAWAGAERLALGLTDTLDTAPRARWPLDRSRPQARHRRTATDAPRRRPQAQPAMTFDRIARRRRRRLGHRARQCQRARRPQRDAVGARRRQRRAARDNAREPAPARRAARRQHRRHRAISPRPRARRRDPAGGAGAGAARGRHGARAGRSPPGTPVIACAKGIERGTRKFMTEVIAECAPQRGAGDPVGPELRRRRGARPADRGDARGARRRRWPRRWRRRSARRRSGPIIRPTCAASRSAARPRTCWRSPPASSPAAGSAPAPSAALTTRGFAELFRFGRAFGARPETLTGLSGPRRPDPDLLERRSRAISPSASRSAKVRPPTQVQRTAPSSPKARSPRRCWSTWRAAKGVEMPICARRRGDPRRHE